MDLRGVTVQLDDGVMRKLVSSDETKRYTRPKTERYTIFPYRANASSAELLTDVELASRFSLCWEWLCRNEKMLRARDNEAMDLPTGWYGYTRPMNLHLQDQPKIGVPQTVQNLYGFFDHSGEFCFNNVRVGGILVSSEGAGWYLLAVLNSPVPNWVFKLISRPKDGGYFEANKQFIAPLPIPDASPEQREAVGGRARELQELHTRRRDLIAKLDARLQSGQTAPLTPKPNEDWLWPDVGTRASWKRSFEAPEGLTGRELNAWAKERHAVAIVEKLEQLDAHLQPGVSLVVTNTEDEMALVIQEREVLRLYDRPDTPFLAAQWRHALRDQRVTDAFDGKRLVRLLLGLRNTREPALRDRILALDSEISELDATIGARERELNSIIYGLYGLTPQEIAMVEDG